MVAPPEAVTASEDEVVAVRFELTVLTIVPGWLTVTESVAVLPPFLLRPVIAVGLVVSEQGGSGGSPESSGVGVGEGVGVGVGVTEVVLQGERLSFVSVPESIAEGLTSEVALTFV